MQAGAGSWLAVVRRVGTRVDVNVLKKVVEQFSLPSTNDYFQFDSFTIIISENERLSYEFLLNIEWGTQPILPSGREGVFVQSFFRKLAVL
jgi:hypothetical protein